LECDEAQKKANTSTNTLAPRLVTRTSVCKKFESLKSLKRNLRNLKQLQKKKLAFPCVSLIIGKILSLTPSGKRRIISVRNPVMLKRMKMQPATKTAAKAASYGKPRPKQMVKVKNAFVPIPPDVEKSSSRPPTLPQNLCCFL
jgi:hypothetical protein